MPEFNFAEGQNQKLDKDRETGDIPAPGLSSNTSESSARKMPKSSRQSSILDSYPERNLSHLTTDIPETPDNPATSSETEASETERSDDGTGEQRSGSIGKPTSQTSSNKWPLLTFLAVFIFFCTLAAIWYFDPWPPLKETVLGWFEDEPTASEQQQEFSEVEMMDFPQEIPLRSWDFFVQVSSWKDLRKAEKDAGHYRARDFDVIVESEFLKERRSTFYRVRIGPFDTRDDARAFTRDYAGLLPAGVFIDSVRIEDEPETEAVAPAVTSARSSRRRSGDKSAEAQSIDEFMVMDGPLTGYAVKVSSFKSMEVARGEARRLLDRGFPSFLTKKRIGSTTWYRVLVGPFEDKTDSDKYMRLINVAFGNEAYTIDLDLE